MTKENLSAKSRAFRYLARRDHSRARLAEKLTAHHPTEEVEAVMQDLIDRGYLNDEVLAERLAGDCLERRHYGRMQTTQVLLRQGFDSETVEKIMGQWGRDQEIAALRGWLEKKRSPCPEKGPDREKWIMALQRRGFSYGVIQQAIQEKEES